MKPPPFAYHAPSQLDEALALLERYGDDAKVLAGGQSLMPLLNFRLSYPSALIDINRVAELSYIRQENGQVRIGALTRQRTIEFSELVRRQFAAVCMRQPPWSAICPSAPAAPSAAAWPMPTPRQSTPLLRWF